MTDYFKDDPFIPAEYPPEAMDVVHIMKTFKVSQAQAERLVLENRETELFINSRYQVAVHTKGTHNKMQLIIHLSIKRRDREVIHDWRDLQEIKNELVGEEFEAVEIYPAESRRVDSANQYHLWVFPNEQYRIPFGFDDRLVTEQSYGESKQRPFKEST